MRNVRVCCGDWSRVCSSPSTTIRLGETAVFLDPPYALNAERMHAWVRALEDPENNPIPEEAKTTNRAGNLYGSDRDDVDHLVARVHIYCKERTEESKMRIALCGYDGEHNALEELGWESVAWTSNGGYGNRGGKNENRNKERIWFSPSCQKPEEQRSMF